MNDRKSRGDVHDELTMAAIKFLSVACNAPCPDMRKLWAETKLSKYLGWADIVFQEEERRSPASGSKERGNSAWKIRKEGKILAHMYVYAGIEERLFAP